MSNSPRAECLLAALGPSGNAWRDPEEPVLLEEPGSWHRLESVAIPNPALPGSGPADRDLHPHLPHPYSTQALYFTFSPEEMMQLDSLNKNGS